MKYTGNQFNNNYKNMDLGDLVKLIRRASDAYYNSSPIMTDTEFDILRDYVEEIAPDHPVLKEIGAPVKSRKKVSLPFFMPSMDKVKPESLDKWLAKYKGPYVVSAKLDGVSALLVKSNNQQKLYTRGNGSVGQDISHLIPYISSIPELKDTKNIDYVVRGELIIKDSDFEEKFSSQKANARNMVSGLVTRKTVNKQELKYTHFVVYEVIEPSLIPSAQMEFALKNGFEVVHSEKNKVMSVEKSSNTLKEWRKNDDYSIDGIIISQDGIFERQNSNPKHSVAFKMVLSDQTKESTVTGVTWTTSKHGLKKPVVQIEPIHIGGVTVSNISGQNGRFIESNMIGKGAIVEVVRRGDVIPYIERIIKPAKKASMPEGEYEWTATKVDIVVPKDDESREKLALAFFSGIGVDGLGIGNLKKFGNAGYKTIPDIFSMKIHNILNIDGFKEKSSLKIYNGIQDIKKNNFEKVPIEKLMGLSGTFGRGLGEKRIKEVFKKYPDILINDDNETELIESVKSVQGFSTKTATQFVEGLEKFKQFANNIGLKYENRVNSSLNDPVHKKDGNLYGKSIVFTGGKDENLMKQIVENGGEISNSVNSKTFAVISKDPAKLSGKSKKAVGLGVPVYSIEVFKNMYLK
uniref:DNA ligase (NAD(+)) n=1 Tax=viral metagenome TaxID=1070528 RepID=A0A6C0L0B2_9ZZZZ